MIENKGSVGLMLSAALVGTMLLAGCQSKEVMNKREYTPAETVGEPGLPPPPEAGAKSPAPVEPKKVAEPRGKMRETPPPFDANMAVPASDAHRRTAGSTDYVVKRGDSLSRIAHRYGVTVSGLAAYNRLSTKSMLRIGQKIRIPAAGTYSPAKKQHPKFAGQKRSGAKKSVAAKPEAAAHEGVYVVKPNDSVDRIARKLHVKRADLMAANKLTPKSMLRIGQKLTVPGASTAAAKPVSAPVGQTAAPVTEKAAPEAEKAALDVEKNTEKTLAVVEAAPKAPATPAQDRVVYVDKEVSIADFAGKYGVAVEVVRQKNPDIVGDKLGVGQMIILPSGTAQK